ncbi:MAG TPA: hypothetical protein VM142_13745 [Acidimicrobiales bacterium]|nr:hypothetical protein [Acidimicrobiales bacterium]
MTYQLEGLARVREWLAAEEDRQERDVLREWLVALARDPHAQEAMPVPGIAAPVFACFVPGSNVVVTYLIAEQYHVVRIIEIASLLAP